MIAVTAPSRIDGTRQSRDADKSLILKDDFVILPDNYPKHSQVRELVAVLQLRWRPRVSELFGCFHISPIRSPSAAPYFRCTCAFIDEVKRNYSKERKGYRNAIRTARNVPDSDGR